jgi:uncharacterized protein
MGERTSHAPGTFSSVDLVTSDADAAKSFYGGLFGWKSEDMDGAGGTCTIFRLDGQHVAGCFEGTDGGTGVPPHWNSYVTVQDVNASVARATQLGGSVLMAAQDVEEIGGMAVIVDPLEVAAGGRISVATDPQGAPFGLFDGPLDP